MIRKVCRKSGIKAALHCGAPEYATKAIGWGCHLTTVSRDGRLLATAAAASVGRWKEITGGAGTVVAPKGGY